MEQGVYGDTYAQDWKKFCTVGRLAKKTEINAQINLRDINNKHAPLQVLSRVRSHHTLMLTEGAVDWPSSSISQNQERRGRLGEEQRRQNSVGFSVCCLLFYVVVLFFKCHSPNWMSTPIAVVVWNLLFCLPPSTWRIIVFFFWVLILAWLCYGCYPSLRWGEMLFFLTNLSDKGKALLLCGFLQFISRTDTQGIGREKLSQLCSKGSWYLQIFLTLQARIAERRVNLQIFLAGSLQLLPLMRSSSPHAEGQVAISQGGEEPASCWGSGNQEMMAVLSQFPKS